MVSSVPMTSAASTRGATGVSSPPSTGRPARCVEVRHRPRRPLGRRRGELRGRRVVPARRRPRAGSGVRRRRQPGPLPRHGRAPERNQPPRRQPLHGLGRRPRPRHWRLEWFHQVSPHDLFDRDRSTPSWSRWSTGRTWWSEREVGGGRGLDPDDGTLRWETEVGTTRTTTSPSWTARPPSLLDVRRGAHPAGLADGVVYLVGGRTHRWSSGPDEVAYFGARERRRGGGRRRSTPTTGEVLWATRSPGDPLVQRQS